MGELESLSGSLGHSLAMSELREGVWDGAERPEHVRQGGKGQRTAGDAIRGAFQSQKESFHVSIPGKRG